MKKKDNFDTLYETAMPKAISDENIKIEYAKIISSKGKIYLSIRAANISDKKISKSFLKISSGESSILHTFKKKLPANSSGYDDVLINITNLKTDDYSDISYSLSTDKIKEKKENKDKKTGIKKEKNPVLPLLSILIFILFLIFFSIFMIRQLMIKSQIKNFTNTDIDFSHKYIMAIKNPEFEADIDSIFANLENARYNLKNLKFKSMVSSSEKLDIEILTIFQNIYDYKIEHPSKTGNYKDSRQMKEHLYHLFKALESVSRIYQNERRTESYREFLHAAILTEQYLLDIDMKKFSDEISIVSKKNENVPIIELYKIYNKIITRLISYLN